MIEPAAPGLVVETVEEALGVTGDTGETGETGEEVDLGLGMVDFR